MSTSSESLFDLWVYLSGSPLLWLTATVGAFVAAQKIAALAGNHTLANPIVIAVTIIGILLVLTGTDYADYFEGAKFVHFLMGPATVAMAVPLYDNRELVLARLPAILGALVIGGFTCILVVLGMAHFFELDQVLIYSLAPKSVTSGIAMGITDKLGGDPALAGVFVIITGILGAMVVTPMMNAMRIKDPAARGFAVGLAAHGIGTARAFQVSALAGTFAGLGMALNGLVTALLIALIF